MQTIERRAHAPSALAGDLLDLLRQRRTTPLFLPDAVPEEVLEEALDAGRFAPNHKRTEPWRFTVVGPDTKEALTPLWTAVALSRLPADATEERREEARRASRAKWESKPTVVVVSQVLDPDPFRREEDFAAVACAIQNVQLAAWALGLGSQWSTTAATRDAAVLARLGIPETERVVGFLFVGYPAAVPEARRRPLEEVLRRTP